MGYFGIPFRNGVPIGLGSIVGFGAPQEFSPSELFLGGTAGAWYDPSDLTTLFTTSAGTTPVAMPGQGAAVPVGLMLDKSQGLVLGSETVTNGGPFTATTGWTGSGGGTLSVSSQNLRITNSISDGGAATFGAATPVIGKHYKVQFTIVSRTAASASRIVFGGNVISDLGPGTYTYYLFATTTGAFALSNGATGVIGQFADYNNISVRELPGNHAIAFNNTTARPELRARVNLLVATATLSTQSVTTQATSYTLRFAGTGSITLSGTATGSYSAGTHTITCTAGTLTLTVSGTVTTADLRPANSGALLPVYQAVVDANTYDTSGFPLYLRFDGIDDSMYTPANLNLSGTDKVAVFAGVRKLSDAALGVISELGTSFLGSFSVFASYNPAANYSFGDASSTAVYQSGSTPSTYAAPITNVLAGSWDLSQPILANQIKGRVNSVAQTLSFSGAGTPSGLFMSGAFYIGSRGNSSLRFNGHLHSLIIAGSAVSAGNISATEQWVAQRTGIVI